MITPEPIDKGILRHVALRATDHSLRLDSIEVHQNSIRSNHCIKNGLSPCNAVARNLATSRALTVITKAGALTFELHDDIMIGAQLSCELHDEREIHFVTNT